MKANHLRVVMATMVMSFAASQASVEAAPSLPVKPKFEPRSYAEFIGADPHPDWLDGSVKAGDVNPFAVDPELPNVRFVTQTHTNPSPLPAPCSVYFGNSPLTIMTTKVTPGTDIVSVEASLQPSLPEGNGFAGVSLLCTITQGANVYACSGTQGEPIMVQRIKQSQTSPISAWRSSNVALSSYHGYVTGLTPGEEVTVTIAARTFSSPAGVLGQVCYGSMAVNYDANPI